MSIPVSRISEATEMLEAIFQEFKHVTVSPRNRNLQMIPKANWDRLIELTELTNATEHGSALFAFKQLIQVHVCLSDGYHFTECEMQACGEMIRITAIDLARKAERRIAEGPLAGLAEFAATSGARKKKRCFLLSANRGRANDAPSVVPRNTCERNTDDND